MSIVEKCLRIKEEIVEIRRKIHRRPELGFEEYETQRLIMDYLENIGIDAKEIAGTGVIGEIGSSSPRIGLRADMDALPLEEKTSLPYASEIKGRMHACGHDAHVAMLLGAAKILNDMDFDGTVRLIFQPAEEGLNGARKVIEDGGIVGLDGIEGIHVWAMMPKGVFGIREGPLLAAVDRFVVKIKGKGGHGSAPYETVDPILAASHYITAVNEIVSRKISPFKSGVISVCKIHGGNAFNIIPDEVVLEGTVRSMEEEVRKTIHRELVNYAEICKALGCECEVNIDKINDSTVNDKEMASIAREVAKRIGYVEEAKQSMGGEDFSEYAKRIPAVFVLLGMGTNIPHHSPYFIVDEDILPLGTAFHVEFALEFLKRKI